MPGGAGEGVVARPDRRTSRWSTPPADGPRPAGAAVVPGAPPSWRSAGTALRFAVPRARSVGASPPRCVGCAVAERWTRGPEAVPEDAGRWGPTPGPPPVRPSAGPGEGAPAPGPRTSRRQVAATTGRAVPPPAVAVVGGAENPSAEPVFTVRARPESSVRDRWTTGDGVAPAEPWAVRPRAIGRTRTGGGGAVEAGPVRAWAGSAARWTAALPDDDPAGAAGTAGGTGAVRTGIAEGAPGGTGVGAGTVGPVCRGRPGSGRAPAGARSPSSGASPPSRAVGGSEGSGVPIPPRARARALPEESARGAGCTEGEGPGAVDEPDGRVLWED